MSPEQRRSLDSFILIRSSVHAALEVAHTVGMDPNPAVKSAYYHIADCLISLDELGKFTFGEANYVVAAAPACTSDDPTNHQGDTCPVHE